MRPAVSAVLHHHGHGDFGARPDVFEGKLQRVIDQPLHPKPVGGGVEVGNVEVDQEVVHAYRRDRITQPFEWHAGVTKRESYLFPGELRGRADGDHAVSPPLTEGPHYFTGRPSSLFSIRRLVSSITAWPIPPPSPAQMGRPNSTLMSTSRRRGMSICSVAASHS